MAMKVLLSSEEEFVLDQYVKWACLLLQTYLSENSMVIETFPLIKELISVVENCGDESYSKGTVLLIQMTCYGLLSVFGTKVPTFGQSKTSKAGRSGQKWL